MRIGSVSLPGHRTLTRVTVPRHAGFVIDELARDRWLHAMRGAMDQLNPPTPYANALMDYFDLAADAMHND